MALGIAIALFLVEIMFMKIIVHTTKAKKLYDAINSKMNKKELHTWEIKRNNNNDILYNHTPDQWSDKALIKPIFHNEKLELIINWWKGNVPDEKTKGYIIGRFTEILMVHFRDLFECLEVK